MILVHNPKLLEVGDRGINNLLLNRSVTALNCPNWTGIRIQLYFEWRTFTQLDTEYFDIFDKYSPQKNYAFLRKSILMAF